MDLLILFRAILKRKWYLIIIPILAVIATYVFTSGIKPVYKSVAQLATGYTTDDQIKLTDERVNVRDAEVKFNNMVQTMNSDLILNLLSYRLIINDLTSPVPFRKPSINSPASVRLTPSQKVTVLDIFKHKLDSMQLLSSFDPTESLLINLLTEYGYFNWQLKKTINVQWLKGTDYVTVQSESEDPLLSAFIVNAISQEFIRYDNSLKQNRSGQSVTFFENLVKDKKRILDEKTELINQYRVSNNVLNYQAESSTKMAQITEYELRREDLQSEVQRLRLSLASVNRKLTQSPTVNDQAVFNENIVRLRSKIDELNEEYIRNGSKDDKQLALIQDYRNQLQGEIKKLGSVNRTVLPSREQLQLDKEKIELDLQVATANLASVDSMIRSLRGSVSFSASKEANVSSLQRDLDKASEEYLQALDRYNTEKNKSLVSSSSVRIIIKGQPNGHPEFSKRYLLIALSGVATFALCAFVIVFIEFMDARIKNPQQFKRSIDIDLAGSVNTINTKNLHFSELFNNNTKEKDIEIFKHFLRKLRFEIESSKAKVILVTSTKPQEGKTFIILCISYLLSLLQKRILIIDTNFKHNSLTQILLKKEQHIRKLESGTFVRAKIGKSEDEFKMTEDEYASSIIYATGHKGINIIGNTGGNESPSEIFAGRDFGKMINGLRDSYDYIILEGAALNNYSDTKELVDYVDKVIPIFSAESVIKSIDKDSIEFLKRLNGKLIGAVLNKIETKDLSM